MSKQIQRINLFVTVRALVGMLIINVLFSAANAGEVKIAGMSPSPSVAITQRQVLNYAPTLAHIPTYTGHKFICERANRNLGTAGDAYNVYYAMKESPATVRAWYLEGLVHCGWKIDSTCFGNPYTISAQHVDGLVCQLYFSPAKKPGYNTTMALRFTAPLAR